MDNIGCFDKFSSVATVKSSSQKNGARFVLQSQTTYLAAEIGVQLTVAELYKFVAGTYGQQPHGGLAVQAAE